VLIRPSHSPCFVINCYGCWHPLTSTLPFYYVLSILYLSFLHVPFSPSFLICFCSVSFSLSIFYICLSLYCFFHSAHFLCFISINQICSIFQLFSLCLSFWRVIIYDEIHHEINTHMPTRRTNRPKYPKFVFVIFKWRSEIRTNSWLLGSKVMQRVIYIFLRFWFF
jgi:hypothetical protein